MTLDRKCERCGQTFNPDQYWMICPHSPLGDETAPLPVSVPRSGDEGGPSLPRPPLSATDYQRLAARTICDQRTAGFRIVPMSGGTEHDKIPVQVLHSLVGIQGEAGEIACLVQKWLWYGKNFAPGELMTKLADEYGDLLWYVMEGLSALGLDAATVMAANIAKLRKRYPDRYTDVHAAEENRDRAAEEKAVKDKIERERMEPCCECGDDYPRSELMAGHIYCSKCRAIYDERTGKPWPSPVEKALPPRTPRIEQDGHGFGHIVDEE